MAREDGLYRTALWYFLKRAALGPARPASADPRSHHLLFVVFFVLAMLCQWKLLLAARFAPDGWFTCLLACRTQQPSLWRYRRVCTASTRYVAV